MGDEKAFGGDAADVLVDLLQTVEPASVVATILAAAKMLSQQEAEPANLVQSDYLTRIARVLMREKVLARIRDLREQQGRIREHKESVERACAQIKDAAGPVFSILSKLKEATELGIWDPVSQTGERQSLPKRNETRRFVTDRIEAVVHPPAEWSKETWAYVTNDMHDELSSYKDVFEAFIGGADYIEAYELIVRPGRLHCIVDLGEHRERLYEKIDCMLKGAKAIARETSEIRSMEPHVDHWRNDFLRGLRGNLVSGELSEELAPLVVAMRRLETTRMIRVSERLLGGGEGMGAKVLHMPSQTE